MALYVSVAVWASLALCSFDPIKHRLADYRRIPVAALVTRPGRPAGV